MDVQVVHIVDVNINLIMGRYLQSQLQASNHIQTFGQDKASYSGLEQPHCTDLPLADAGYTLQTAREHFHVAQAQVVLVLGMM